MPGSQFHFGSNHQGEVRHDEPRLHDAPPAKYAQVAPRPLDASEVRRHTFEPASRRAERPGLAEATGTTRQFYEVSHGARSAPFGVDDDSVDRRTGRYMTETGRHGPRGQATTQPASWPRPGVADYTGGYGGRGSPDSVMQPSPGAASPPPPGAIASAIYQRDVHGQKAAPNAYPYTEQGRLAAEAGRVGNAGGGADLHGVYSIGLSSAPPPNYRAANDHLRAFTNGSGQLDDMNDAPTRGAPPPRTAAPPILPDTYDASRRSPPATPPGGQRVVAPRPVSSGARPGRGRAPLAPAGPYAEYGGSQHMRAGSAASTPTSTPPATPPQSDRPTGSAASPPRTGDGTRHATRMPRMPSSPPTAESSNPFSSRLRSPPPSAGRATGTHYYRDASPPPSQRGAPWQMGAQAQQQSVSPPPPGTNARANWHKSTYGNARPTPIIRASSPRAWRRDEGLYSC